MGRKYDDDHLEVNSPLHNFANSYIINLKLPYGESDNYIRVVAGNVEKAKKLPYRTSIFKVSSWPHKMNRRIRRYNEYEEFLLYILGMF